MENILIPFNYNDTGHQLELAFVAGTPENDPFLFGNEQAVLVPDFFIATTETTQVLWKFILGDDRNRSQYQNDQNPVEQVSWYDAQDFLTLLNQRYDGQGQFRLPSETEWEYAARGGQRWQDGFHFAGSNDMDESGWYEGNAGPYRDRAIITGLKNEDKGTVAHVVGQKKPNQLGLYDMNGNLWEWCQDWFVRDTSLLPGDGSAFDTPTNDKVLRGGCHHNGAIHCTNTKRYEIGPRFSDGCIGFRVALSRLGKS